MHATPLHSTSRFRLMRVTSHDMFIGGNCAQLHLSVSNLHAVLSLAKLCKFAPSGPYHAFLLVPHTPAPLLSGTLMTAKVILHTNRFPLDFQLISLKLMAMAGPRAGPRAGPWVGPWTGPWVGPWAGPWVSKFMNEFKIAGIQNDIFLSCYFVVSF